MMGRKTIKSSGAGKVRDEVSCPRRRGWGTAIGVGICVLLQLNRTTGVGSFNSYGVLIRLGCTLRWETLLFFLESVRVGLWWFGLTVVLDVLENDVLLHVSTYRLCSTSEA